MPDALTCFCKRRVFGVGPEFVWDKASVDTSEWWLLFVFLSCVVLISLPCFALSWRCR